MTKKQRSFFNICLFALTCTLIPLHTFCTIGKVRSKKSNQHRHRAVDPVDGSGKTRLHCAVNQGNYIKAKNLLLLENVDSNASTSYGRSPLHVAAWKNRVAIAQLLLQKGAITNNSDGDGNTALHLAASKGFGRMVKLLLDSGARKDAQNVYGNTPLHSTAEWDQPAVTGQLLRAGASPFIENRNGELPSATAFMAGSERVKHLLIRRICELIPPPTPRKKGTHTNQK